MGRPMGGINKKWTNEDRKRVVSLYLNHHLSMYQISNEQGIPIGTVKGWIARFYKYGEHGLVNKKKKGNLFSALHTSKSLTEVDRLKLELLKRDVEIERLKKGYQVKGVGANKEFVTLKDKSFK